MMSVDDYKKVRFEGEEVGEETLFILRSHFFTNIGWILGSIFLLILPLTVLAIPLLSKPVDIPISGPSVFLAAAVWVLIITGVAYQQFLNWYFNLYILTNRRIVDIDFFGLFYRRVSTTTLANVQDITYTKAGIIQNFFDFGDIHIQTAGTHTNFEFHNIPDPEGSQKQIFDLLAAHRERGYIDHGTVSSQVNKS